MQVFQTIQSGRFVVAAAAMAGGMIVAGSASAAVITTVDPRYVIDNNQDDLGNGVSTSTTLAVGDGDGPAATEPEYRVILEFNIGDYAADIAAATNVDFSITFERITGNAPQDFSLYAVTAAANEDGIITPNDYEATAEFIATWNPASLAEGQVLTADVTSFVKADNAAGQTWSTFRLQVVDPAAAPDGDTAFDFSRFVNTSPALSTSIVPEPASLALLGLGGLALARRRNRA